MGWMQSRAERFQEINGHNVIVNACLWKEKKKKNKYPTQKHKIYSEK